MGKEYFSHDYNARTDPKLVKLVMKSGMDALGIYWCIIEMLYEQGGYIQLDFIDNIAFELHTQCDRITDVLKNYDLFKFEEDKFYSESVLSRLAIRDEISRINSDNAKSGWQKRRESKDVAKRSQSGRNGNKSKLKESKVNINTWRESFEVYLSECKKAYEVFMTDTELMKVQQRLNPGINIKLSIEKGYVNFWGKEAGWKHKKKSKSKEIDWHNTIVNSISMNKVYYTKEELAKC